MAQLLNTPLSSGYLLAISDYDALVFAMWMITLILFPTKQENIDLERCVYFFLSKQNSTT